MDYDNFFLGVDNMAESVDFYKNVLGLPVKFDFRDKGMIGFQIGENEPAIILKDRHMFPDAESTI
ncbi:VOC family protein [Oenococcus oeni]